MCIVEHFPSHASAIQQKGPDGEAGQLAIDLIIRDTLALLLKIKIGGMAAGGTQRIVAPHEIKYESGSNTHLILFGEQCAQFDP